MVKVPVYNSDGFVSVGEFEDKPEDEEYFQCGIYYSPDGCAIDYYGQPVEDTDGVYVYDGRPKKVKIMYKSEKICDNWYYFEDAVR